MPFSFVVDCAIKADLVVNLCSNMFDFIDKYWPFLRQSLPKGASVNIPMVDRRIKFLLKLLRSWWWCEHLINQALSFV